MTTELETTDGDGAQEGTGLDQDTIHELLSNGRRRAVLNILNEKGEVGKKELSSLVAADEYDKTVEELESQERKRIHISLHQQHLSALEDARVIESNGTIQLTERADELLWHLQDKPAENPCAKVRDKLNDLF